ncbi:sensor histidine kinase [Jhaorihella thermophila]|uniref:histidine kinase n=1 Tax=Jhaorihella thermophila TaxID=488547 RepID=A0A1H5TJ97_9RHOB|nr:sensor histidine kinase [Jhaorihella thermophila]SEF62836.1 two-component system, OmpR family, sensor histidine kinase TctE [Jhaorihella thermophila]
MKPRGSIRRRLVLQLVGVEAILSVALFVVVRAVAQRAAEGTQDDILAASATSIADSLRTEGGQIRLELPYSALSMLGTLHEDRVFYRVEAQGGILTGYADLRPARAQAGRPGFSTYDYRGEDVRAVTVLRSLGAGTQQEVAVTVAQTRQGLEAISRKITATATAVGAGFFLLATALSLLAANHALAPIARRTEAVTRRGPSDLRPLSVAPPAELWPLARALNGFMARLRGSLARTEDFIAEAAHRVRTPLATVRAQAELVHRRLNDPDKRRAVREMIRAIDETSRSAGQMLDHAMVGFRSENMERRPVDLRDLVRETCNRLAPTADLREIVLRQDLPDAPVTVEGDPILLQAAFLNILDNAVKYGPHDSAVTVSVTDGAQVAITVRDRGPGFGGADLKALTGRYVRGESTAHVVGSGLGLTIAQAVA